MVTQNFDSTISKKQLMGHFGSSMGHINFIKSTMSAAIG